MRARGKHAGDVGVTFKAGPVTHVRRTRNLWWIEHRAADCAARDKHQRQDGPGHQTGQRGEASSPIHKRPPGGGGCIAGFPSSSVGFQVGGRVGCNSRRAKANWSRMATEKCCGGAYAPGCGETKSRPFAMPSTEDQSFWPGFRFPDANPQPPDRRTGPGSNQPPVPPEDKDHRVRRPTTADALPDPPA